MTDTAKHLNSIAARLNNVSALAYAADEIDRLRKIIDVITAPPLTIEEAEAALDDLPELDQAEKDAMAGIDIKKIIAYATDPMNMSPEEAVRRMIEAARKVEGFDGETLGVVEAWLEKRWSS